MIGSIPRSICYYIFQIAFQIREFCGDRCLEFSSVPRMLSYSALLPPCGGLDGCSWMQDYTLKSEYQGVRSPGSSALPPMSPWGPSPRGGLAYYSWLQRYSLRAEYQDARSPESSGLRLLSSSSNPSPPRGGQVYCSWPQDYSLRVEYEGARSPDHTSTLDTVNNLGLLYYMRPGQARRGREDVPAGTAGIREDSWSEECCEISTSS